jgi:hypothetical protein
MGLRLDRLNLRRKHRLDRFGRQRVRWRFGFGGYRSHLGRRFVFGQRIIDRLGAQPREARGRDFDRLDFGFGAARQPRHADFARHFGALGQRNLRAGAAYPPDDGDGEQKGQGQAGERHGCPVEFAHRMSPRGCRRNMPEAAGNRA